MGAQSWTVGKKASIDVGHFVMEREYFVCFLRLQDFLILVIVVVVFVAVVVVALKVEIQLVSRMILLCVMSF